MNPDFPYKVGDRLTFAGFDRIVTITAIGHDMFLATRDDPPAELAYPIHISWRLVPPPIRRYTVEIRPAQPGEQHLQTDAIFGFGSPVRYRTWSADEPSNYDQIVITGDHTDA